MAIDIVQSALTHDLKTTLAGQIARAAAVFCVDEVVIFDDGHVAPSRKPVSSYARQQQEHQAAADIESGYTAFSDPNDFLYHVLSYLETPPYLRRSLFPYHPNLKTAGALPSLDMPHHLKADEWCQYREGVTVNDTSAANGSISESGTTMFVDAGLQVPVRMPSSIPTNTRVTLKFTPEQSLSSRSLNAEAVAPEAPREEAGYYWGYSTRIAASLGEVFTESPFGDGYDYSIGMSERGIPLRALAAQGLEKARPTGQETKIIPRWKHLLIVFGGVAGLEKALSNDKELQSRGVREASELFDAWVNLIEGQGSRTIRTEEAVWLGLMGLRSLVVANDA